MKKIFRDIRIEAAQSLINQNLSGLFNKILSLFTNYKAELVQNNFEEESLLLNATPEEIRRILSELNNSDS